MEALQSQRGGGALARVAAALVAAGALAAAGCNAAGPSPGEAPSPAPTAQVIEREVTWPRASEIDAKALAALTPASGEQVRASRVPVLLPGRAEWLAGAALLTKPTWTTASLAIDGATVVVTASRASRKVPGVGRAEGNRAVRSGKGFVTQNEGIWAASWIENGVAYSVEVECAQAGDARCADEAFTVKVANELVYVGGAGEAASKEAP